MPIMDLKEPKKNVHARTNLSIGGTPLALRKAAYRIFSITMLVRI
jgi:hypothetical protein